MKTCRNVLFAFAVITSLNAKAAQINELTAVYTATASSEDCLIGGKPITADLNLKIKVEKTSVSVFNQFQDSTEWYESNRIDKALINKGPQVSQSSNGDNGQITTQTRTLSWNGSQLKDEGLYSVGRYQVKTISSYSILDDGRLHFVSIQDAMLPIDCKMSKK